MTDSASGAGHAAWRPFSRMSAMLKAGLMLFGAAGLTDLAYHSVEAAGLHDWTGRMETVVGQDAYPIHVLLFLGMLLIWVGIMAGGRRDDA